ncbi:MAG: TetR/AcrR family transcriptional regulator [Actinobacteria bacterium]|nr:TetR/AcrR family transcriptional regulator [Actinomycetota bacterium]
MTTEFINPSLREPITRDSILDNASALLAEKGLTGFRLKDLAKRLNVTIPNLYRYFQDREAIIRATYVRAQGRDAAFLCAVLNATADSITADSNFTETISSFWPALLQQAAQEQRVVRFRAVATIYDGEFSQEIPGSINEVHLATTRFFRQAQVHGLIDSSLNPEALSLCIRSMVLGMVLRDFGNNINVSDDELNIIIGRFYKSVLAT